MTSAALFYKTEAFSTNLVKLMGRNVAGSTFLDALLDHSAIEHIGLFIDEFLSASNTNVNKLFSLSVHIGCLC